MVKKTQADQPGAQGVVQARVLVACDLGQPNDVVDVDAELAETMSDVIDTSPEAVAYALSIAKE